MLNDKIFIVKRIKKLTYNKVLAYVYFKRCQNLDFEFVTRDFQLYRVERRYAKKVFLEENQIQYLDSSSQNISAFC